MMISLNTNDYKFEMIFSLKFTQSHIHSLILSMEKNKIKSINFNWNILECCIHIQILYIFRSFLIWNFALIILQLSALLESILRRSWNHYHLFSNFSILLLHFCNILAEFVWIQVFFMVWVLYVLICTTITSR